MAETIVRSAWSSDADHLAKVAREGGQLTQGGPYNPRADQGHIAPSVGKSGPVPVVGMPPGVVGDRGRRF
jgi:hypothetical protein